MDTYLETKNRIYKLLEKKDMSIHSLAMKSGLAPSTIKNILYGKSKNPGIVTLKLLCEGLNISLYEFFDTQEFKSKELENIN